MRKAREAPERNSARRVVGAGAEDEGHHSRRHQVVPADMSGHIAQPFGHQDVNQGEMQFDQISNLGRRRDGTGSNHGQRWWEFSSPLMARYRFC